MTDKELLELAAKAIGSKLIWHKSLQPYCCLDDPINNGEWNPLTDDGDAFRLAVDLKITAILFVNHYDAMACDRTATRRAIVRAAAEIGKAIP